MAPPQARPPAGRRIALILAADWNRENVGDGVAPDATACAAAVLRALAEAGYQVGDAPRDPMELRARLLAASANANPAGETLSFADYSVFFTTLPPSLQGSVAARWGAAERDPFFRPGRLDCGRFAIHGFRAGNLAVLLDPACGCGFGPESAHQNSAPAPPHSYFAAYAWLAEDFRADAVIHLGEPQCDAPPLPAACFVRRLAPPLTSARISGLMAELERRIDERLSGREFAGSR